MEEKIINQIKSLAIDMIQNAGSGHPGICLGAAPILYSLYAYHLNANPSDPNWVNRDRFILSAGHGSALLYSVLYMAGYPITMNDLKQFRQIGSITPGHPEITTPGVDMMTGPLGQGVATAVGMALAEAKLEEHTKIPDSKSSLINHKIYVLCGDGDLMEGISYEAMSLAGSLNLNNLIILYDSNNTCLDSSTNNVFDEKMKLRAKSLNFNYFLVKDGNSIKQINKAINKAKKSLKPSLIEIKTIIGKDSLLENNNKIHGGKLSEKDYENIKTKLGIQGNFYVDENLKNNFSKGISDRVDIKYSNWSKNYQIYKQGKIPNTNSFSFYLNNFNYNKYDFKYDKNTDSLRDLSLELLEKYSKKYPEIITGSADLGTKTGCFLEETNIVKNNYSGKNILFGVREHLMAAVMNGMAIYKYLPFCSTFLSFSDYLKPAMRISCMMNLPVTYIFSHDSINIGEDGKTHQPIEQLSNLRTIPNMYVYRPCDAIELINCYDLIIQRHKPASIILPKINTDLIVENSDISKGAYIALKEIDKLDGIIIATGTEVHTAVHIANELYQKENISIRVVSMPCRELYLEQNGEYQEQILPKGYKKIVIEAGVSSGWEGFVYSSKYLITLNKFGFSGKKDDVLSKMEFDYETIKEKVISLLK